MLTLEDLHVAHDAREQRLVPSDVLAQHLTRLDLAPGTPGLAPALLDAKLLDTEAARLLVTKARRKVGLEADQAYTKVALEGRALDDEVLERLLTQTLVGGRIGSKLVAQGLITAEEDARIIVRARAILQEKERELLEKERANDFREAPPAPEVGDEPTDHVKPAPPSPVEEERLLAEPTVRVQKTPPLTPSGEARVLVEPTVTVRAGEKTESDIMREGTERLSASELPYTVGGNADDTAKHSAVLPLPRPDANETQKHAEILPLPETPGSTTTTDPKTAEPPSLEGKTLRVLSGYEIEKELGRGAMGVVYSAREVSLKRQVALKVLPPAADAEAQKRFMREARAIAALDHPGIVPVYQYGESEGHFFIAMKLIDGRPLRQLAAKPMAARRAAAILEQVARAMAYAHEQGVIHRDLKPANILVEAGDKAWVVDFGIAKLDTEATLTAAGEIMGTPAYMSPEQALQLPLQPSTDVYSLGAVLYMITTGQPPFPGQNAVEVLPRVAADDPPRPSKLRADIPPDLETIILVAMMKEPERRYVSALAMAEDLRAFQAGEPIAGKRPSPIYLARRWAKRHALPLLAAAVVLVAAIGLLSVRNVKAEHTALVERQAEETEARAAQKLDELERVYAQAAARTRRTPDEERASAEKMRSLLSDAAALTSNGNVAKWTRAVADFLGGRAREKREDARRLLLVGKRDEAKTAAFLAAALDPTSPENETLQANMNRAAVVNVKLTTPAVVNWVRLDKDLHPAGDWQVPAVSGSDQRRPPRQRRGAEDPRLRQGAARPRPRHRGGEDRGARRSHPHPPRAPSREREHGRDALRGAVAVRRGRPRQGHGARQRRPDRRRGAGLPDRQDALHAPRLPRLRERQGLRAGRPLVGEGEALARRAPRGGPARGPQGLRPRRRGPGRRARDGRLLLRGRGLRALGRQGAADAGPARGRLPRRPRRHVPLGEALRERALPAGHGDAAAGRDPRPRHERDRLRGPRRQRARVDARREEDLGDRAERAPPHAREGRCLLGPGGGDAPAREGRRVLRARPAREGARRGVPVRAPPQGGGLLRQTRKLCAGSWSSVSLPERTVTRQVGSLSNQREPRWTRLWSPSPGAKSPFAARA